jgi:hypothetical protein
MRHAQPGRDGSIFGRTIKVDGLIVDFFNSRSVMAASSIESLPDEELLDETMYTGTVRLAIDDSWEGEGVIEIYSTEPQPFTVRAVNPMLDREPGQLGRS